MTDNNSMSRMEGFIQTLKERGYMLSGSIFKVDYNGSVYTVNFCIGPQDWDGTSYRLPGHFGKARNTNFDTALEEALRIASEGMNL